MEHAELLQCEAEYYRVGGAFITDRAYKTCKRVGREHVKRVGRAAVGFSSTMCMDQRVQRMQSY